VFGLALRIRTGHGDLKLDSIEKGEKQGVEEGEEEKHVRRKEGQKEIIKRRRRNNCVLTSYFSYNARSKTKNKIFSPTKCTFIIFRFCIL
jgi:hypothetical protein